MQGKIKPHISAEYPLEQAAQALNDLLERKATGKVVLVVG
jgi:NADPH2:quinone reductase